MNHTYTSMEDVDKDPGEDKKLKTSLLENLVELRAQYANSTDLLERQMTVSGVNIAVLMCEGMINLHMFSQALVRPLTELKIEDNTPQKLADWIRYKTILAEDQKEIYTFGELFQFIMSGFAVILIDGLNFGIVCGLQGFSFRSISEPNSEVNVRGSREGFVEPIRINLTMVRRRIKSPTLKFEMSNVGDKSKTDICLIYLTDMVSDKLLRNIRHRLSKVKNDIILDSGYLQPYLENKPLSIFPGTGVTERPDTLCAKINEGRVAILVDGTPFAIIVPYLFNEHFQSLDDYAYRPFYATFIRCLKYLAFFISILLPGLYVAAATFHPELLPHSLLFNIAAAEESTPFPLVFEAILIHLIYEIMREAGLRLPRPIGHAVSIVGALVIGDAAVTAGLIGSPMVMVVALTAISSFVVPSLYEPVAILKFVFIIVGGTLGLFGIFWGIALVLVNLCAVNPFGVPSTAPTTPFSIYGMRDIVLRMGWKTLGKENMNIQDLPGSELDMDH